MMALIILGFVAVMFAVGVIRWNWPQEGSVVLAILFGVIGIAVIGEEIADHVYESNVQQELDIAFSEGMCWTHIR